MLSGNDALNFLALDINEEDPGESSHWKKYHSSFEFNGSSFNGLQGFGGLRKPRKGLFRAFETFLQLKYRKISEGDNFFYLDKMAATIALAQDRNYDLDFLRQTLTISFLRNRIPKLAKGMSTVCVIGDGFGSMTSLLLASNSASRIILVNLTKTLLVDLWYLKLWLGDDLFDRTVCLVTSREELKSALKKPIDCSANTCQIIAIRAINHDLIRYCSVELAINIASMQEMNPSAISQYFTDLRMSTTINSLYFYCCNRQEKYLPDGTVTKFSDYPWSVHDQFLVDELCPWHQEYYRFKPPFFKPYDGLIQHRLAILKKIN